jgi:hypothetical protein
MFWGKCFAILAEAWGASPFTSSHDIPDIGKAKGSRERSEQVASEGIAWDVLRQVLCNPS